MRTIGFLLPAKELGHTFDPSAIGRQVSILIEVRYGLLDQGRDVIGGNRKVGDAILLLEKTSNRLLEQRVEFGSVIMRPFLKPMHGVADVSQNLSPELLSESDEGLAYCIRC